MPSGEFTSESAREAQKKAVEARKRNRETPEARAQEAIKAKLGKLTEELLDAALGEGAFADLKSETRLTALLRSLEWGLGKAPTAPKIAEKETKPEIPTGDDLFE